MNSKDMKNQEKSVGASSQAPSGALGDKSPKNTYGSLATRDDGLKVSQAQKTENASTPTVGQSGVKSYMRPSLSDQDTGGAATRVTNSYMRPSLSDQDVIQDKTEKKEERKEDLLAACDNLHRLSLMDDEEDSSANKPTGTSVSNEKKIDSPIKDKAPLAQGVNRPSLMQQAVETEAPKTQTNLVMDGVRNSDLSKDAVQNEKKINVGSSLQNKETALTGSSAVGVASAADKKTENTVRPPLKQEATQTTAEIQSKKNDAVKTQINNEKTAQADPLQKANAVKAESKQGITPEKTPQSLASNDASAKVTPETKTVETEKPEATKAQAEKQDGETGEATKKEGETPNLEKTDVEPKLSAVSVAPIQEEEQSIFSRAFGLDDEDSRPKRDASDLKKGSDKDSIFSRAFEEEKVAEEDSELGMIKKGKREKVMEMKKSPFHEEDKEFMSRVDEAWFDRGSTYSKYIVVSFCSLLVFFVVWASFASIDEVARGQGQVVPSQRTQLVQHLEGGILSEILVREGQTVEPEQILARVDNVTAESLLRDTETQITEATLALIRLEAELKGEEPIFPEQYMITAPQIVEAQEKTYESRRRQQEGSRQILLSQKEQKGQELNEARSREQTYKQALELVQKRVDLAKPLVARRLYAEVDFLNLQQEAVRISGDISAVVNSIAKIEAESEEIDERISLGRREFESEIVKEINMLRTELATLRENQTAGTDRVTRTELRSQVRGIVNRILLNTKGGVVKPGENIMEIVPLDDTLVIETKVRPQDIAFIHPNQKAVVRITAYDSSIYGSMRATVEQIGADTVTNERGDVFFLVKVRTEQSAIVHKGEVLPITPGMVATVDILTGKKTVLSYLLKPITKASQYALKER